MVVKDIVKQSGLSKEVAESLYWKCLWLRDADEYENINWSKMLKDRKYRCMKKDSSNKR